MKVAEKFTSINGEGTRAGELAVFVRFKGCNLRCSYCDTLWANEPECPYNEETPEEILNYVLGTGIHNVTLTGGEPLLQKDIRNLIHLLLQAGLQVEVETNGAVALAAFCEERPVFTMDYKLPSSGCEEHMITENMKLLEKNDGIWIWHVNHKESFVEVFDGKVFWKKESDEQQEKNLQKERTIELEISELTSWLLGYKIPENISETVKAEICCINRIFLDEIV